MARPSISVPDELLDEFDDAIWDRKVIGELDRDADRSQVIRELMREYVEETEEMKGNRKAEPMAAD
jgi:metal-responsive CopG/Arc/MetJ family transcriptional regulator